jgi:hypothetical protein
MGKEILLKSLFIVLWNFKLKLCESAWLRLESWRYALRMKSGAISFVQE